MSEPPTTRSPERPPLPPCPGDASSTRDGTHCKPKARHPEDRPLAVASALRASGGRPATGSIVWEDPETKTKPIGVRVTKANGRRTVVRFDPGTTPDDARLLAPVLAEGARFAVAASAGETVATYAERWCAWRASRGLPCVPKDRVKLARHVLPLIGALNMRAVSRDDLKRLVAALDVRASAGSYTGADGTPRPFGWKTAVNVWATVRALFRDACGCKRVDLCVREDNPAASLTGPDTGARKAKVYLWPSEFLALVSCERVPVRWRRLVALAVYTFMRAGELAALRWEDVDLDHGTIHVHRASDGTRDGTKATKTGVARRFPIEPALLPLLQAMHDEAGGNGSVVRLPSSGKQSSKLKYYLGLAGVMRADLFASDATRKALTFHDLRATGITWCAVRGDDALKIMGRAGHSGFETTRLYLREAENLSQGFGTIFPPLPPELVKCPPGGWVGARGVSAGVMAFRRRQLAGAAQNKVLPVGAGGFEGHDTSAPSVADRRVDDANHATQDDAREPTVSALDPVEAALADAVRGATAAGRWDVVAELARELEARRRARGHVTSILPRSAGQRPGARS